MKNIHKLLFIFIIFTVLLVPSYVVRAIPRGMEPVHRGVGKITCETMKELDPTIDCSEYEEQEEEEKPKADNIDTMSCDYILGDPNNEDSFAYMIQRILNYIKILAPLLVVLLSGFDFAKNALTGDQDAMKKATKKLGIRLGCAVGVYLAPLLTGFLINFINNSSVDSTCNIK